MVAAITLADASIEALDALCTLEQESFTTPWSRTALAQEFSTPHAHVVVAHAAGHIVGYLCRWLVIDEVHIQRIAVHPHYRQQGIGQALMAWAVAEAQQRHAHQMLLEVEATNTAALALYRAQGFVEQHRRREYYGAGRDALCLQREVRATPLP